MSLYQIGGIKSQCGTDYIIIENSICFVGNQNNSERENCRLIDIMDRVEKVKKSESEVL